MNIRTLMFFVIMGLILTVHSVSAEEIVIRGYQLSDHGSFQLKVPQSWQEEIRQPPGNFPPTIVFSPKEGNAFKVIVTPLFSVRENVEMPTPSEVKSSVNQAIERVKSQAVEKTIPVVELKGPLVIGYYFTATDRAPKPGEYKYLTQGMFRVGELAPTFTILTNDGAEDVVAESLSMLKGAEHLDKSP